VPTLLHSLPVFCSLRIEHITWNCWFEF